MTSNAQTEYPCKNQKMFKDFFQNQNVYMGERGVGGVVKESTTPIAHCRYVLQRY